MFYKRGYQQENQDFVGINVTDILSSSGVAHTVTTSGDHGLNYITRVGIASIGANYGDGSGSVQTPIMQN